MIAINYLTNGWGAINESDMPFENNENNIDISNIENKTTQTMVIDSVGFNIEADKKADTQTQVKEFIKNYGAVTANIYMENLDGDTYNNATGAICCKDNTKSVNHQVMLIGWDDNYSKDNFNTKNQPSSNGAWIVKNSYGSEMKDSLLGVKQDVYNANKEELNNQGIMSADQISDDDIIRALKNVYGEDKIRKDGDDIYITIGDNGYMYISYEDVWVLSSDVNGIQDAVNTKNYDKIYMNDELGADVLVKTNDKVNKLYIANEFKRDNLVNEALSEISINNPETYIYQVYINPNGNDLTKMQAVKLENGDSQTVTAGYHILKFAEPIMLTGDNYAIALKLTTQTGEEKEMGYYVEYKLNNSFWENAEFNRGESFISSDGITWEDKADDTETQARGNVCVRAYTNILTLSSISVSRQPNKTTYTANTDSLDLTGGELTLKYNNNDTKVISMTDKNVSVTGFDNTKVGNQKLTVSYEGKTTTFDIKVNAKPTEEKTNTETNTTGGNTNTTAENTTTTNTTAENTTTTNTTAENTTTTNTTTENTTRDNNITNTEKNNTTNTEKNTTTENTMTNTETNTTGGNTESENTNNKRPISSNLDELSGEITSAKGYMYITKTGTNYCTYTIKISGIKIGDKDDTYTYAYYLSGKQGEDNITSWINIAQKYITKNSDGTINITIDGNTKDLKNQIELKSSDNIFLYLKETATINGITITSQKSTKDALKVSCKPEIYIDDVKKGTQAEVTDFVINTEKNKTDGSDTTTATTSIPKTGVNPIILISILILLIGGTIAIVKYRNIDK